MAMAEALFPGFLEAILRRTSRPPVLWLDTYYTPYSNCSFQGIFGKTWFSMVNTSFLVEGRHETLKKEGIWSST